ncbi:site-specific integrase [Actinacidiphila oryziradicis]|uniref:Uncharacterized protein n=1 Tax=Actinacidiphila oryziradicis TaxID=2571141 RepID=A0A4U0RGE3_9ACTN|nr:hypothetical protein [Actinacidiphila oryziradicis]TJZ94603.1 hypothetical protein FCI23_53330 [Actinacidiphila oryziradicis]
MRLTKTDPYGRSTDVVRITAQDDPAYPVAAWRAWRAVLEAHDQHHTGPLLRRIDRHGRLGGTGRCAGRQPSTGPGRSGRGRCATWCATARPRPGWCAD